MYRMKLSHFNFDLPDNLLAEYPTDHRDESKLMVLHRETETIEHKYFKDIVDYFDEGDIMVRNNTKVAPVHPPFANSATAPLRATRLPRVARQAASREGLRAGRARSRTWERALVRIRSSGGR